MTVRDSAEIVYLLHSSYPADRKASEQDLAARIDTMAVTFADYDISIVRRSVTMWIRSNKYMPTVQELLQACSLLDKFNNAHFIGDDSDIVISEEESEKLENILDWVWEDFS